MADAVVSLLPSGMNDRLSVYGMGEGDNSPGPSTPPALRRGTALLGDRPSCDTGRMGAGIEGRQSEHRKERVQGFLKKGGIRGVH